MNEQTSNPNAINEGTNEQAAVSSLPARPEPKPEVVTEVQPEVQKETDSQAADKRKQVLDEAVSALALTKSALAALDEKESARALATLAEVTGKLELIVAREPTLALAPVDVRTIVHDLFANKRKSTTTNGSPSPWKAQSWDSGSGILPPTASGFLPAVWRCSA